MLKNAATSPLEHARSVLGRNLLGQQFALTSVCSAHPLVLRAALSGAREAGQVALLEATCNQVNQDGGYTGMTPADFVGLVKNAARAEGVADGTILLGGDHLGPQPWRHLPAASAMAKAEAMVAGYVAAGFQKIHLDCSMRCADDPATLPEATIAERAAILASAAEAATTGRERPIYVIGTEVPPPGGMGEGHAIVATDPGQVAATWTAHAKAFSAKGLEDAFARVCAVVVQPGLDFGNETVVHFDLAAAQGLSGKAATLGGAVFEAHSTDYQRPSAYPALVKGHFAILKVGPAATFALRETIYALEQLAAELFPRRRPGVRAALEAAMLAEPGHWKGHYSGEPDRVAWLRHFSWSDRVRYYWTAPQVQQSLHALFDMLDHSDWPLPLISQYLPRQFDAIADGRLPRKCEEVAIASVRAALLPYHDASNPHVNPERHS
ncbi:MAG: class II D-tagatose-bisphosphate aldolase, non-catalytic subunit [Paracoccaceae bacterium]